MKRGKSIQTERIIDHQCVVEGGVRSDANGYSRWGVRVGQPSQYPTGLRELLILKWLK